MAWYVASLRDGDTHLGSEINGGKVNGAAVSARCGQTFRPLARLIGKPPDPLQVCCACRDHKNVEEHHLTGGEKAEIMGKDKDKNDGGKHGKEDYTRNGRPNPPRPVPQPPDPNKHDR